MELFGNICAVVLMGSVTFLVGLAVLFAMDVLCVMIVDWISGIVYKVKAKKKPKSITAVLYNKSVDMVVDMVIIKEPAKVINLPDFKEFCNGKPIDEVRKIRYEFFCIMDNGNHVYIERS